MSCSELLTLPFTAGNLYTSRNGRTHHDGSISAVVVVTSVLAFVTALISLQSESGQVILDPIVIRLSLTIIVAAGICSAIYLVKRAKSQTTANVGLKPFDGFHRLQLGFLWLFGFGVMVVCILEISRICFCKTEITQAVSIDEFGVNVGYHVSRMLLVVAEVGLISCFSRVNFDHCLATYYAMLFIILANASVWIYYYLALDAESSSQAFIIVNATVPQMNNTTSCFYSSAIGTLSRQTDRILFPINTEFSLLVLKFVLGMWNVEQVESTNVTIVNSVMGVTEDEDDRPDVDQVQTSQQTLNERSRLINTDWEYRLHNRQDYTRLNNTCSLSFYLAVAVSISMCLPLAAMYLVLEFKFPDNDAFYRIIATYEVAYKMAMTIALLCTWVYLLKDGKPITEHRNLHSQDYILLMSTFGAAVYFIHVLIGGSIAKNMKGTIDIAANSISIVSLYLQTTLLLQTKRYDPKRTITRHFPGFRSLCIVLSILNFGYWITDSFVGMKFQAAFSPKVEVFGAEYWTFVMHYIFPLVIFYRLECGFTFLRLYGIFGEDMKMEEK